MNSRISTSQGNVANTTRNSASLKSGEQETTHDFSSLHRDQYLLSCGKGGGLPPGILLRDPEYLDVASVEKIPIYGSNQGKLKYASEKQKKIIAGKAKEQDASLYVDGQGNVYLGRHSEGDDSVGVVGVVDVTHYVNFEQRGGVSFIKEGAQEDGYVAPHTGLRSRTCGTSVS